MASQEPSERWRDRRHRWSPDEAERALRNGLRASVATIVATVLVFTFGPIDELFIRVLAAPIALFAVVIGFVWLELAVPTGKKTGVRWTVLCSALLLGSVWATDWPLRAFVGQFRPQFERVA